MTEIAEAPLQDFSSPTLESRRRHIEFGRFDPRGWAFVRYDRGMSMGPDPMNVLEKAASINVDIELSRALVRDIQKGPNIQEHERILELDVITPEEIANEPFEKFYTQLTLFAYFGNKEVLPDLIPAIVEKVKKEGQEFCSEAFPNDAYDRRSMEEHIKVLALACYQGCEEKGQQLSKETVELTYREALQDPEFLYYALLFDERNKDTDNYASIKESFFELIQPKLYTTSGIEEIKKYIPYIPNDSLKQLAISALKDSKNHSEVILVLQALTPHLGVEELRKLLRHEVNEDESFRPRFSEVFAYMELDPTSDVATELTRDVYDKINFEEYAPNYEMQGFEEELIKEELEGSKKVLDVACGTGRHLMALDGVNGMHIKGLDITDKHVDYIKQKRPESDVEVASWFKIPLPDGIMDAAYMLGRSFTHNTTIKDAVACLEEIGRVVRTDGIILIDLPDPNKGDYKKYTEQTKAMARKKGLKKILPGLISDSPDLTHYYDRYAPTAGAFQAIAALAGLAAWKLPVEQPFHGVGGEENVNTYWILKKATYTWINEGIYLSQAQSDDEYDPKLNFSSPSKLYQTRPSSTPQQPDGE